MFAADVVALLRSEKHELKPSTLKMTDFTHTLDLLKSGSDWDKFTIQRLGVEFDRTTYLALNTLINDRRWYDPKTETDTKRFADRSVPLCHN